ncbi:hypothetical protein [Corynebacterium accolens]|uniref:hypothetical protein n=1 Tax=Corynebacterium accolens TaxID=38284 RepID=UPI00254A5363|nr:hypothetical protein [Corynebacterium accolens]MDK8505561.1 hypothetical protein [Corynebacterium accolens]MDK8662411.1 hypothetical protein [Corynebacterium accolens]
MKCQNSHCTKEATTLTDYNFCEEHATKHEEALEWGKLHTEGKATTQDYPGYTPITVAKNAGIQTAPSTYDTLPESV